jgi:hypothetical protein
MQWNGREVKGLRQDFQPGIDEERPDAELGIVPASRRKRRNG